MLLEVLLYSGYLEDVSTILILSRASGVSPYTIPWVSLRLTSPEQMDSFLSRCKHPHRLRELHIGGVERMDGITSSWRAIFGSSPEMQTIRLESRDKRSIPGQEFVEFLRVLGECRTLGWIFLRNIELDELPWVGMCNAVKEGLNPRMHVMSIGSTMVVDHSFDPPDIFVFLI